MVGDLQQMEPRQPAVQNCRLTIGLQIAREEHLLPSVGGEQDQGRVVGLCRGRDTTGCKAVCIRPQDLDPDCVEGDRVSRRKPLALNAPEHQRQIQCGEAGAASRQTGIQNASDAIALRQEWKPSHVVLVRMAEHEYIQSAVPWRNSGIESGDEPIGIGPAVDQEP